MKETTISCYQGKIRLKFKVLLALSFLTSVLHSQSSLRCDFGNEDNKRNKTFNFWDIENKIFSGPINPASDSQVDNGGRARRMNFIRTLGGWRARGEEAKDFSGDLATFSNGEYVFDAQPMIDKIKQYRANGIRINQIVLDNPPWVFQRGLNFVENINNRDYLTSTQIETYGNAIPPNSNYQWRLFVRSVMDALVAEFGVSTVENWRFRGGTEIETPGHWAGTKQQYFNHYRTIVEEVKRAVPNAKVGAHFREANFTTNRRNYRNQIIESFSSDFFDWTKENNVPYDFIGISYYPFFNRLDGGLGGLDVFNYYDEGIKPFRDNPNFNRNADIEIHEFWLFTNFGNGLLVDAGTSHGAAYMLKLARLAYERDIKKINQWGYGKIGRLLSPQRMAFRLLGTVEGQDRYRYTADINTKHSNTIDALFTTNSATGDRRRYNAFVSNYSHIPEYQSAADRERVVVNTILPVATGKNYEYRIISYGRSQSGFNMLKSKNQGRYRRNESNGGWIRNGANAQYGHISKSMGGSGSTRRSRLDQLERDANTLQQYNQFQASDWIRASTRNIDGTNTKSRATITLNLESFMLQKIEIRLLPGRTANKSVEIDNSKEKILSPVAEEIQTSVSLYPNPAKDSFNLSLQGFTQANITISNMLGKLVYKETTTKSNIVINTTNRFTKGVYLVKVIDSNGKSFTKRLIIN